MFGGRALFMLSLWALRHVKVKVKSSWFVTWALDQCVTWHCGWVPFILSHQLAKFGIHKPCESGTYNIFDLSRDHVFDVPLDLWVGFPHLSQHPAKFGVHRPFESGHITFFICHMTATSKCHVTLWVDFSNSKSSPC